MTNPWRKTMILLLFGRTRPLRSHSSLCESLYPQGNPHALRQQVGSSSKTGMGAQSMECLLLDLFQCLSNQNCRLRSKQGINLWTCCAEPLFLSLGVKYIAWLPDHDVVRDRKWRKAGQGVWLSLALLPLDRFVLHTRSAIKLQASKFPFVLTT